MLISISGAQGSGKTTILQEIERLGYNVIGRKTSRSILTEWNKTLDDVYADNNLMLKFQDELILRKEKDEAPAIASTQMWFTERSYADVFAYTLIVLGKNNKNSDWLNAYYDHCQLLNSQYGLIFYVKQFDTNKNAEDDGVRGINKYYSKLVDRTILTTLNNMAWNQNTFHHNFDIKIIETPKIDDRVVTILRNSHDIWLNWRYRESQPQVVYTEDYNPNAPMEINREEFLKS